MTCLAMNKDPMIPINMKTFACISKLPLTVRIRGRELQGAVVSSRDSEGKEVFRKEAEGREGVFTMIHSF